MNTATGASDSKQQWIMGGEKSGAFYFNLSSEFTLTGNFSCFAG